MDDCPSAPLPDPQSSTAPECSTCEGYGHTSKECPTQFSPSSEEGPPEDQAAGQEDTYSTEDPYADDVPQPQAYDIGEIHDNLEHDPPQPVLPGPLPAAPVAPMLAAPPVNPRIIDRSYVINTTSQRHYTNDAKTLIRVRTLDQPLILYLEGSREPIICVQEGTAVLKGHPGFLLTLLNVLVLPAPYKRNCITVMAQLAKMKQSMVALLSKRVVAQSTVQNSSVPSAQASGPPDPGPSDPGPYALGPSAPCATTVPSLTEFNPPEDPPTDPDSSESDNENNIQTCLVTYNDMAGDTHTHYNMPQLVALFNNISDTPAIPALQSIVTTHIYRITMDFYSI
eukprot:gene19076-25676_t